MNSLQLFRYFIVLFALLLLILKPQLTSVRAHNHHHQHDHDDDEDDDDSHSHDELDMDSLKQFEIVTYCSSMKLLHAQSGARLHSHRINWGSGSGQQSITGQFADDDPNSLWIIREKYGGNDEYCPIGRPIKCGDSIRLQHSLTKKFLHSHLHHSPLSHRQEVSCYGSDQFDGSVSDTGDNWILECSSSHPIGSNWLRDNSFRVSFQHIDTGKRLYARKSDMFDQNNCRNCPIVGQLEISAHSIGSNDDYTKWYTQDGIFFPIQTEL